MRTEQEIKDRILLMNNIILLNNENEKAQYGAKCQLTGLSWVLNELEEGE